MNSYDKLSDMINDNIFRGIPLNRLVAAECLDDIRNRLDSKHIEEAIVDVFPSRIKQLNEEGWYIVQVIGTNYEKVNSIRLDAPYAVGEQMFKDEYALICLVRKV